MANIYQGDNTGAFGESFLTINLVTEIEPVPVISKAVLKIGGICKTFDNPSFPLVVNFSSEETAKMGSVNAAFLAVWDSEGRKRTCEGSLSFKTNGRKV